MRRVLVIHSGDNLAMRIEEQLRREAIQEELRREAIQAQRRADAAIAAAAASSSSSGNHPRYCSECGVERRTDDTFNHRSDCSKASSMGGSSGSSGGSGPQYHYHQHQHVHFQVSSSRCRHGENPSSCDSCRMGIQPQLAYYGGSSAPVPRHLLGTQVPGQPGVYYTTPAGYGW